VQPGISIWFPKHLSNGTSSVIMINALGSSLMLPTLHLHKPRWLAVALLATFRAWIRGLLSPAEKKK
jgi:hypothetical protein